MTRRNDSTWPALENDQSVAGPETSRYRPDIDGLRAIAVIAVLGFHAFPKLVPGGFAGVDIFFVISGYLITSIIDQQMLKKNFSVVNFYTRRVLRIVPALITVVLATFAIGWLTFPVLDMETLGANIKGAAALIENFILHEQFVGYFEPSAERLPLLHLWSLGIEEQYYVVWPAALLLISCWPQRKVAIVGACAVGSFVLCLLNPAQDSAWAFYAPTTRAWELLAGSWLALYSREDAEGHQARRFDALLAAVGLASIIFVFWELNAGSPWPGFRTAIPVLAVMAVIATRDTFAHRLLSARVLVSIGLISYPLYLWHFPLFAVARVYMNGPVPTPLLLALLVSSFPLAWLTYRFIERPFRFGNASIGLRAAPLAIAMVGTWLIGMIAVDTRGLPARFPEKIRGFMLSGSETWMHWRRGKCLLLSDQSSAAFEPECAGGGSRPLIALWGDSYASALYPGLLQLSASRGYDIAQYTASACPPLIGYSLPERPFCKSINDDVILRLGRLRPDVVVLQATWGHAEAVLREDLPRTVGRLRAFDISNIVLMGPPPTWQGAGLSTNVLDYYRQTQEVLPARSFFRSTDEWTRGRDGLLRELSDQLGIRFISVRDVFCNENGCLTRIGPNDLELTAFDPGHLTVPGSTFVAHQTLNRILDSAPAQSSSGDMPR